MQSNVANLNSWTTKHTTEDTSQHGVALAFINPRLFVAWTGGDSKINVASSTNGGASWEKKVILNERSSAKPYLVHHKTNDSLVLAWQGVGNNKLNFSECRDLNNLGFGTTTTTEDTSGSAPAVGFQGDGLPWVTWQGGDSDLNSLVASGVKVADIASGANRKRTLYEKEFFANSGPALCLFQGKMVIGWQSNIEDSLCMGVLSRGGVAVYGLLS